jgi:hypothetical protein
MTKMDWEKARRQSRVGGPQATPEQRGRQTQRLTKPVGKKSAGKFGVCRKCRQRFRPGDYVMPFYGKRRGPGQVYQHKGRCPSERALSGGRR